MNPEAIKTVQQSWRLVVPIADSAAMLFYERLFALDPKLRALFAHVDSGPQRQKLIGAIGMVVGALQRIDTLVPTLEALARRHTGYGVTDAHYATVGAALLWTLEKGLGAHWTPAVEQAWTAAYTLLADVMRNAAAGPLRSAA